MKAVCFVGWSGVGKTTLIAHLVPLLELEGFSVGYLKTSHHGRFEMDREGKDTARLFSAGAQRVGIVSATEGAVRFRAAPDDRDRLLLGHLAAAEREASEAGERHFEARLAELAHRHRFFFREAE